MPLNWNLSGGEHQLWVQVNRLSEAWQTEFALQPEEDRSDNFVLRKLMVEPFDAYVSDLCPGRVDVEIGPVDVIPEPDKQRVWVRIHNVGNKAAYNLPVLVIGEEGLGIGYSPAIPPCGGTTELYVPLEQPLKQGESLLVRVNPEEWADTFPEDDFRNNQVAVAAGLDPEMQVPPGSGLEDYDFRITKEDIEMPEPWLAMVTVHNLGTRDAADVPILVQNQSGRQISDRIPLVRGTGIGVAAIRVGYVWTRGGTLTFTINPQGGDDAYPEKDTDNNIATIELE
jgi:hypothetical protein